MSCVDRHGQRIRVRNHNSATQSKAGASSRPQFPEHGLTAARSWYVPLFSGPSSWVESSSNVSGPMRERPESMTLTSTSAPSVKNEPLGTNLVCRVMEEVSAARYPLRSRGSHRSW